MPNEIVIPPQEAQTPLEVTYVERYNVWHGSYGTLDGSYQLEHSQSSATTVTQDQAK